MRNLKWSFGLLTAVLVSACASTPPPPPSVAVLTLSGEGCVAAPLLTDAVSLTPEKKKAYYTVSTLINEVRPCLTADTEVSRYVVYALPLSAENHTVSVGGRQEAIRTFAPSVRLLDADGKTTRQFADDRFAVLGNIVGVQFRPLPHERYILVQSNPKLVGKSVNTLETRIGTNHGYALNPATGYGSSYQTQHGIENTVNRVFSHEGFVDVTVQAATGMIGLPNEK
ncbi:hypothetical protein [Asticcacaulis machinosus]|uniref:Lipoprotein n=1 Tax=Asticcacaulis machinosus TaxID=2984211 RepID=A0ABT5HGA9_9CAUL|nr:hypothetical protein [Asticcacaulis machinosus]MDC7675222.1 hypothetical protein [Asticcacaulis machinosus]